MLLLVILALVQHGHANEDYATPNLKILIGAC